MFYLFDEPTTSEHYKKLAEWTKQLHHEAPDARVLTTYFCGPKDIEEPDAWASLMKVPKLLKDTTKVSRTPMSPLSLSTSHLAARWLRPTPNAIGLLGILRERVGFGRRPQESRHDPSTDKGGRRGVGRVVELHLHGLHTL
eukprot:scaffold49162_cov48-Prasinocladus_malaysianus.AAC.3